MILTPHHLRFFLTTREHSLPLFIESIGFNSRQEDVSRPEGYPCFHWIQTVSGEGMFTFKGGPFVWGSSLEFCCYLGNPMHTDGRPRYGERYTLHLTTPSPLLY